MRRTLLAVLVALTPVGARAQISLGIEATLAAPRLGVQKVPGSSEPLTAAGDVGASALLRLAFLGVGAALDRNVGTGGSFSTRSLMGGLVLDLLPVVRLELLGETGTADTGAGAVRFRGARPGLSLKLPAFPVRVGVWGLARWGLPGAPEGRPAYGMLARAGIEF